MYCLLMMLNLYIRATFLPKYTPIIPIWGGLLHKDSNRLLQVSNLH